MRRFVSLMLAICMSFTAFSFSIAEEITEEQLSEEELAAIEELDSVDENIYNISGKIYEEKNKEDFDRSSPALYRGLLFSNYSIYEEKTTESKKLFKPKSDVTVDILYIGLMWMIVRYEKTVGYVKREWIAKSTVEAVQPGLGPFNVQKHTYVATTATACHVRKTMDKTTIPGDDGNNWVILNPGTMLSIWTFQDGWAIVNYWRSYGYIDPNELTDLIPVSPTDSPISDDTPIAAYTSYYTMKDTESNHNRIHNISTGISYVSRTIPSGASFDANKLMGPYNASKGYRKAGVLIDGTTTQGYGGGTCQVSSTLYNSLIQLPGLQITYRRPHGGNGASYLPIHCDAAVGNSSLNLRFTNNYQFPVRIEGHSSGDGALLMLIYRAD